MAEERNLPANGQDSDPIVEKSRQETINHHWK